MEVPLSKIHTHNSMGANGANGANGADVSTPSITTPDQHVSSADIPITQPTSNATTYSVTYSAGLQPHDQPDQSASFVGS